MSKFKNALRKVGHEVTHTDAARIGRGLKLGTLHTVAGAAGVGSKAISKVQRKDHVAEGEEQYARYLELEQQIQDEDPNVDTLKELMETGTALLQNRKWAEAHEDNATYVAESGLAVAEQVIMATLNAAFAGAFEVV